MKSFYKYCLFTNIILLIIIFFYNDIKFHFYYYKSYIDKITSEQELDKYAKNLAEKLTIGELTTCYKKCGLNTGNSIIFLLAIENYKCKTDEALFSFLENKEYYVIDILCKKIDYDIEILFKKYTNNKDMLWQLALRCRKYRSEEYCQKVYPKYLSREMFPDGSEILGIELP